MASMSPRSDWVDSPDDPDLDVAVGILGNRNKTTIVRHLWLNGPTTGRELVKATGLLGPTFSLAMQQLEEWLVVSGDLDKEQRHGRLVTYTLDRDRFEGLVQTYMRYVTENPTA